MTAYSFKWLVSVAICLFFVKFILYTINLIVAKSPQQVPPAAAFHESVVMKDILFVWGGRTDTLGQYHSHLHLFSVSLLNAEWRQHLVAPPELPAPCSGACSAAIGRTIFSYGGEISLLPFRTSNELYKLTIEDMRWKRVETRGSLPEGRHRAGMCSVNGKLLLMGGYGPLPSERRHPQAEYREGTTGEGWNNELFEFDPQTGTCLVNSQDDVFCVYDTTIFVC